MKIIKKIIFALLIIVLALVLVSFILPQNQHVERSTVIAAPAEKIYSFINNPRSFNQWSPWANLDPDMKLEFTGPESGEGSGMKWQSEQSNVGSGSWEITKAIPNESIEMLMDFNEQGTATSAFQLQPQSSGTKITWGFDTDAGMNPMMRWFGLMMDSMVGGQYEKGLATLKQKVESGN